MSDTRISAAWLTDEMAHALAAACPPLQPIDVTRAADSLAAASSPAQAIELLLRQDVDPTIARGVVEALMALHDLGRAAEQSIDARRPTL